MWLNQCMECCTTRRAGRTRRTRHQPPFRCIVHSGDQSGVVGFFGGRFGRLSRKTGGGMVVARHLKPKFLVISTRIMVVEISQQDSPFAIVVKILI